MTARTLRTVDGLRRNRELTRRTVALPAGLLALFFLVSRTPTSSSSTTALFPRDLGEPCFSIDL
jgi:hypothetical protein